jgi:hypothetical protein
VPVREPDFGLDVREAATAGFVVTLVTLEDERDGRRADAANSVGPFATGSAGSG